MNNLLNLPIISNLVNTLVQPAQQPQPDNKLAMVSFGFIPRPHSVNKDVVQENKEPQDKGKE